MQAVRRRDPMTVSRFRPWALAMPLALAALTACDGSAGTPQQAAPVPVRVETVRLSEGGDVARYAAVIRPRIEADVGFRVGGKMVGRMVDVGSRVAAGTVMARLDPADLDLQERAVAAQVVAARAAAESARVEFRYAERGQGKWTSQQEYERRKAAMDSAEAQLREAEAQLQVARNNSRYATLVSDGDGVVTAVLAEAGQVVAQGQPIVRVAQRGEMEAVADIPEQQMGELSSARMSVELWSMPGISMVGRLREVSPSANAQGRTYRVRVTLLDPPPGVRLGMTATLVATSAEQRKRALLPLSALTKEGTRPAVWVLNAAGDGLILRPVQVAAYAGDRVVVTGGLAAGERIVTAGVHKLDASQKVRVWTEPEQ